MLNDTWILIVVIVACFIAGYAIISFVIGMLRSNKPQDAGNIPGEPSGQIEWPDTIREEKEPIRDHEGEEKTAKPYDYSEEQRHAAVLGLPTIYTVGEVKAAFQRKIAKCQPGQAGSPGGGFDPIDESKAGKSGSLTSSFESCTTSNRETTIEEFKGSVPFRRATTSAGFDPPDVSSYHVFHEKCRPDRSEIFLFHRDQTSSGEREVHSASESGVGEGRITFCPEDRVSR
jgi:hypothetical protein